MIVHIDAKSLEWVGIVWLSQDKVGIDELRRGIDQHTDNQARFKLPSRLIAKTFVFRLVYGGSAYAYSKDVEFESVGFNSKKWQEVIDEFYNKYKGIARQHTQWVQTVTQTGRIVMPTGRVYEYKQYEKSRKNRDGMVETWMEWPRTTILNYPVQGLGADLMAIVRVLVRKYLMQAKLEAKLICTIHDSIDVDCPDHEVSKVVEIFNRAFKETPDVLKRTWGIDFNVPFYGEVLTGKNFKDLNEME
jgi:DNA polymerase I-like protein with 3'-5' exonuclease and polymerase domains